METPRERIEDYLDYWAEAAPLAEACVEAGARLTYADLRCKVDTFTAELVRADIGEGDVIAVLAPPSSDFLASFLAACRLGAVWLGINPKYKRGEMLFLVEDAQPRLVLARAQIDGRAFAEELAAIAAQGIPVRLFADIAQDIDRPNLTRAANPVAALVYTSGSTGKPKAARLTHRGLIRGALVRSSVWRVEPFRTVNNVPINHVGGLGDIACTTLVRGGCQVFLERFTAAGTLKAIGDERISYWYQAPTMFQMCLDAPEAATTDWSSLQAAIWSGGRASDDLVAALVRVADRIGVDYSMTESIGAITLTPLTDQPETLRDTVGWPDPGRAVRIVGLETGQPVEPGCPGEIQIGDDWRFAGYAGQPPLSSAEWFATGDLGQIDVDGALRLTGRAKDMFKSGGYNVYPREIEQAIEAIAGVVSAAVLPVPDTLFGEVGLAFVVHDKSVIELSHIEAHCRAQLANYKVPKRFVALSEMPMLPIGKVDKQALALFAEDLAGIG
ncbi:MAG: acyl--CoA ligase [Novosphingobium sp.]|nr:acyl--CoA ligase [Novosphingobium sp.]